MSGRIALSKKTRFEVFKRDGFSCQYCGAHPPAVILHCDHIHPVAEGGTNDIDNLITACESCNQGKGARLLSNAPESLSAKAARIAEAEEQLEGYQEILRAKLDRLERETWDVAEELWPGCSESGADKRNLASIKTFVERLGGGVVEDLARTAVRRKPYGGKTMWLYFCGCCWHRIRALGESQQ